MHPRLGVFVGFPVGIALPNHTTERRLDMPPWAAEPVIEIEVAEGGVEIVFPQPADHAATQPDAFGLSCRPAEHTLRLSKVLGRLTSLLLALFGRFLITALGKSRGRCKRHDSCQ
jgi:hypothetical protein